MQPQPPGHHQAPAAQMGATEASKLFYLTDLDNIYQMRPNLLKSDPAFRSHAPTTLHPKDPQAQHGTWIRGRKGSVTQKPNRIVSWKVCQPIPRHKPTIG